MRVSDLVANPQLGIDVCVPGVPGALHRPVTWCASTESIDPARFLTPGTVMLTSGMALNVTDARIWDAYAERLAQVPIAALAFGLGPIHETVPQMLVRACEHYGIPLLVVAPEIPFIHVLRDAQDALNAERYDVVRRGAALADECTRIAAAQGTLQDVLHRIAHVVGAQVWIEDSTGITLLSEGEPAPNGHRTEFTLPGGEHERFRLIVVERGEPAPMILTLLSPVAAVVSMQLSATLGLAGIEQSRKASRLTEAIYTRHSVPTDELMALARDAELDPYAPIGAVVLESASNRMSQRSAAWRTRVILAGDFPTVRFVDEPDLSTIFLQGGDLTPDRLLAAARVALGGSRSISMVVGIAENAAEIGLTLRIARRTIGSPGVTQTPALTFDTVLDTLRHPGSVSLAKRLLNPLTTGSDQTLLQTLDAYVRHSGATPKICEELFIHRNTLAYRLAKIEAALGADLSDGETRATLLMALRLR